MAPPRGRASSARAIAERARVARTFRVKVSEPAVGAVQTAGRVGCGVRCARLSAETRPQKTRRDRRSRRAARRPRPTGGRSPSQNNHFLPTPPRWPPLARSRPSAASPRSARRRRSARPPSASSPRARCPRASSPRTRPPRRSARTAKPSAPGTRSTSADRIGLVPRDEGLRGRRRRVADGAGHEEHGGDPESRGGDFDAVVKTTILLADMDDFAKVNAILRRSVPERPARAGVLHREDAAAERNDRDRRGRVLGRLVRGKKRGRRVLA